MFLMSEFQNNQGANATVSRANGNERPPESLDGIAYKGERTDFRYDPIAAVKKTWINFNKPVKLAFDEKTVEDSEKQINRVENDLVFLSKNPEAIENTEEMHPSFQGYAERKGFKNPDTLSIALEHYAATEEFISNFEAEMAEEQEGG
jgi:hypothetical protein